MKQKRQVSQRHLSFFAFASYYVQTLMKKSETEKIFIVAEKT